MKTMSKFKRFLKVVGLWSLQRNLLATHSD